MTKKTTFAHLWVFKRRSASLSMQDKTHSLYNSLSIDKEVDCIKNKCDTFPSESLQFLGFFYSEYNKIAFQTEKNDSSSVTILLIRDLFQMKGLSEKYTFLWVNITASITSIFVFLFNWICEIKDNFIPFLIILRLSKSLMYNQC